MLITTIPAAAAFANPDELAWLDLGDTSAVTAKLTLPATGPAGEVIVWSSDSPNLWEDGTVLRPASGADVTATLVATVHYEGAEPKTKSFTVGILSFGDSGAREIANVKWSQDGADLADEIIKVPVGSSPSLPYRVWVEYTDGHAEYRSTKWPWGNNTNTNGGNVSNGPPASGSWTPSNV